jgi:hypothetical protein
MLKEIISPIKLKINQVNTLEEASRIFCEEIYTKFEQPIVLIRIFASIPYGLLPNEKKGFVVNLLRSAESKSLVKNDTKVLTLLGTYGKNPEWNLPSLSKGHIAIPLLSGSFIESIPMMNGLFNQLGVDLSFDKNSDSKNKNTSAFSGIFYIKSANQEVDDKGRKIIANQEFVRRYNVKSVFGFGGGYIASNDFFTSIVFLSEQIKRSSAETLSLLGNNFKMVTKNLVSEERYFN